MLGQRSNQTLTCEEEEQEHHDDGVAKVEERRHEARDVQLGHKVVNAVYEQVERGEPRSEVTAPPPVVVLDMAGRVQVVTKVSE